MTFTKEQLEKALTKHHIGFTTNRDEYIDIESIVSSEVYGKELAEHLVTIILGEVK